MSTWRLFGRAFIAARKEIPPKQWVIRMMLGAVTGTANHAVTSNQVFPWKSIGVGIGVCLAIWIAEILWVMVTSLPLKLQAEVEELRVTQKHQEKDLRMEIIMRLRCEYLLDHPDAAKQGDIPREWIVRQLFKMGARWNPDDYARGVGIGIK